MKLLSLIVYVTTLESTDSTSPLVNKYSLRPSAVRRERVKADTFHVTTATISSKVKNSWRSEGVLAENSSRCGEVVS